MAMKLGRKAYKWNKICFSLGNEIFWPKPGGLTASPWRPSTNLEEPLSLLVQDRQHEDFSLFQMTTWLMSFA